MDAVPSREFPSHGPRERMPRLAEIRAGAEARGALPPIVLSGFVRLAEFLIVLAAGTFVHLVYVVPVAGFDIAYYAVLCALALAASAMFHELGVYQMSALRKPQAQGLKIAGGLGFVFLAAIAGLYMLKQGDVFSRVWLVASYGLAVIAIAAERILVFAIAARLTRGGQLDRRTVIVGGGDAGESLLRQLTHQAGTDLRILGVFDDRGDARAPDMIAGYPKLGSVADLVDFARHARVDLVIFAMPITAEQRLLEMLRQLWVLPVDVRLAAHTNKLRFRPRSYSYIGAVPVLDLLDKPITGWDVVIKSVFDRVIGALCLALFAPLMAFIALAIKLDSRGPVFFKQKRFGFNNELIEVYKFRSMYSNMQDDKADKLVTRGDPRVTRAGRFLRKTSLDELPQLINVAIMGNLSLVGPRPHAMHAKAADRQYEEVVEGYFARHRMRPGITGWAQVNGWRGETDTPEKLQHRVEHDLYYIENWSILFDMYILAITPLALLKAENAY